jgi:hypothetical protein
MTHSPSTFWPASCAWTVVGGLALVAGCAGGAWLERPLAAELPVDVPNHSYPTAVRGAGAATARLSDDAEEMAAVQEQPANVQQGSATTAEKPAIQTPRPETLSLERQQSLITPLAVVPPELVPSPRSQSAAPTAAPFPTAQGPSVGPAANLPFLGSLAAESPEATSWVSDWQPPAVAPPRAATSHSAAPETISTVAPAAVISPPSQEESPVHLDKARGDLIQALEAEIRRLREANTSDEELPRLEQQLRLAYLTAGRLDDAVAAVESLESQQQEAYKNLMFGLGVWLSPDEARRPPLRSAKVLHSLRDATSDLAAGSKLELKNLVFCERVDYFGWYTEFPRKEFQPKQQVILYVEVENFAAEQKGPAGFETELQGSYEILDASGQIIASRQLQLDKEICRNYRRDYFLAYRLYMPENITPGRYRLELTVEDLKARGKYQGRKLGEGMIEFTIR